MKTIICGSRTITNYKLLEEFIIQQNLSDKITLVFSGGAGGVDTLGEKWANYNKVEVRKFIPDWNNLKTPGARLKYSAGRFYDATAGLRRNSLMIDEANAVIALWDGESRGTKDTIDKAKKKGIPVYLLEIK